MASLIGILDQRKRQQGYYYLVVPVVLVILPVLATMFTEFLVA